MAVLRPVDGVDQPDAFIVPQRMDAQAGGFGYLLNGEVMGRCVHGTEFTTSSALEVKAPTGRTFQGW